MSDTQLAFELPKVDGHTADEQIVKLSGKAGQVMAPMRFKDPVVLLFVGHVKGVAMTEKITDDGVVLTRTATVAADGFDDGCYLLDEEAANLAGTSLPALAAACRLKMTKDRDVQEGQEPLPLEMYDS